MATKIKPTKDWRRIQYRQILMASYLIMALASLFLPLLIGGEGSEPTLSTTQKAIAASSLLALPLSFWNYRCPRCLASLMSQGDWKIARCPHCSAALRE